MFDSPAARRPAAPAGFTLVEILVVVVILGILAAIVIPQFTNAGADAERSIFATNLKHFASAANRYHVETGTYVVDGDSGTMPAGFEAFVDPNSWEGGTPIGGVWDTEANSYGFGSMVGVHFQNTTPKDDAYMQRIDAMVDDGDLQTGTFRKFDTDRFYFIVFE